MWVGALLRCDEALRLRGTLWCFFPSPRRVVGLLWQAPVGLCQRDEAPLVAWGLRGLGHGGMMGPDGGVGGA